MASSIVRGDVIIVAPVLAGASPSETVKNLKEEKEKLHCLILLQVCTLAAGRLQAVWSERCFQGLGQCQDTAQLIFKYKSILTFAGIAFLFLNSRLSFWRIRI